MAATVSVSMHQVGNRAMGSLVLDVPKDIPLSAGEDMGDLSSQQASTMEGPASADGESHSYWCVAVSGGTIRYAFATSAPTLNAAAGALLPPGVYFFSATPAAKFYAIDATTN